MLMSIRDKAQGWIAWTIVILISIPFALWGINEYFNDGGVVSVAEVDDVSIDLREFQRSYQAQRQRLQNMFGDQWDPALMEGLDMKKSILNNLVEQTVTANMVERSGFAVSDQQLSQVIKSTEPFIIGGDFSRDRYQQLLRNAGLSESMFEYQQRTDLMVDQLQAGITQSVLTTAPEIERLLKLDNEEREVRFVVLKNVQFQSAQTITDEAVKTHYEQNQYRYQTTEQVSVRYVELSTEKMAETIAPSDEAMVEYFEENKDSYLVAEERQASHLLLRVSEDADDNTVNQVRDKIVGYRELALQDGAVFSSLAKEYSEDPGSSKNGGELGFFSRGVMAKTFEETVFAMNSGDISDPVKTRFGWHIIQLMDVREQRGKTFSEAREEIRQALQTQEAEQQFYEVSERLTNLAYEHADSLQPIAEELGLTIQESVLFSRQGGMGISRHNKVVSAAFSEEVLGENHNSEVLEITPTHFVVVRLLKHQPKSVRPFDQVAEKIRQELVQQSAAKAVSSLGEKVLKSLRQGQEETALSAENLSWEKGVWVARNKGANTVPVEWNKNIFRLAKTNFPQFDGFVSGDGDYVLLKLSGVRTTETMTAQVKETKDRQLKSAYGRELYRLFLGDLKRQADIKLYPGNIR
jgi:peptidyl-prolyl cis-trans isomerase D